MAGTVLAVGLVASFFSFLAAQPILHGNGFVAVNGYAALSLGARARRSAPSPARRSTSR